MHDRFVSRRTDALHQCFLVFICNYVVSVRRGLGAHVRGKVPILHM